ncbi:hypothetical protein BJ165DRAFT_356955 [Panaeolus papilionaceus]|nr:hypothetical protein BJ165DRAFT_356955 [Panaeolus papilionaceus]
MVQTRAATKRQQEAHLAQSNRPAPLAASSTIIQINPSATGQGVHTRWIRPEGQDGASHAAQNSSDSNDVNQLLRRPAGNANNQRMQWPTEHNGATHAARPQGRDLAVHLRRLGEDVQNGHPYGNHDLASPFQDHLSTSTLTTLPDELLRQESTYDAERWNDTFQHISQTRVATQPPQLGGDEVSMLLKKYRRGLGPHGTIIVDRNGDPIVPSLVNSQ